MKKALCVCLCLGLLFSLFAVPGTALSLGGGKLYVDGASFSGSLQEAIAAAEAGGGLVEVEGTVYTGPVGDPANAAAFTVHDVTIAGRGSTAKIELEPFYLDAISKKLDVITVLGGNVVIKNLRIDACFRVDFALRIFSGASNVLVENVVAEHGTRGAINILSPNNIAFVNTQANASVQGGFYFDDIDEAGSVNISFEDCSTTGNLRTGVLARKGYTTVVDLDLSGITCYEGNFAVEERIDGSMGDSDSYSYEHVRLLAPPKNASGSPIDTSVAICYKLEDAYKHYRYGIDKLAYQGAMASIQTERYGFSTRIYYLLESQAAADLWPGESLTKSEPFPTIFYFPISYFCFAWGTIRQIMGQWRF
ncbi:MAG: right-handed parallel beta-helix repeat-containing protein [Clostridium sp.]|jgi:hypothetical protein|nr:right-handed parallel beta-helix repeat-containing protein [Clostridium sp.]